jgi:hypothetical protein
MKLAARFACFALSALLAPLAGAANSVISIPTDVQRFGPLVVVATHDESPAPETFRSEIFTEQKASRLRLIHRLGMDSIPALQEIWTVFLKDHAGEEDRTITQFVSGGMLPSSIGEPGDKQIILDVGFDDTTEHPLEIRGVFNLRNGYWTHVATLACRCQMSDDEEPARLRPYLPHPPGEWAITLWSHTEGHIESHSREIRFRLRDGALWPLIEFESMSMICPQGTSYGPSCNVTETNLEQARLIGEDKELVSGFTLVSRSGPPPSCDKCGLMLFNPKCASYLWDETAFAYRPSPFKPAACGIPTKQASNQRRQAPSIPMSPLHK